MTLRDDLQEVLETYVEAYRIGDAHGCAAHFLPDALLMSPYGPPARGRREIEAVHKEWTGDDSENKTLDVVEFGGADDLAWCLARFSEGAETGVGLSLNVFERQTDGRWLIRMCSLNADEP